MLTFDKLYLGGAWTEAAGGQTVQVHSPHDGRVVGSLPLATPADVDTAVRAARRAFDEGPWPRLSPAERIATVEKASALYTERMGELNDIITAEMGSPKWFSDLGQALGASALMQLSCGQARELAWEEQRGGGVVRREAVGVVGISTPWNVPQITIIAKLIPALLAGCTAVVKPSPEAPLDGLLLAEILDAAGFPEGVVSILPGDREVGAALVAHPLVDGIAFTGSSAVGRWIASTCGQHLKRCSLELGGKSAAIILDDARLDRTVEGLKFASYLNNGEACVAQSRILAPASRYDEVVEALGDMVSSLRVGDPADPETYVGPLVSDRQQERVHGYIELGLTEGATAVAGGTGKPEGFEGAYVRPTLFRDVTNDMRIAREEIFGPVICVIPYDDARGDAEAVRLANDTDFGLAGSVWGRDRERCNEVARSVRSGTFGINGYAPDISLPFGGVKASGIGREYGAEAFDEYTSLKAVYGMRLATP